MPANLYGNERLARLLGILRPAPVGWVTKAKRIFSDRSFGYETAPVGTLLTDGDLATLRRALDDDPLFRERFDVDPVAAVEAAGMRELASGLEQELRELVALAERIATDDSYRARLNADPVDALAAAGMPAATAEQLLHALAVSDDVLAKLPEVVAHRDQQPPLRARVVLALLGSAAVIEKIRAAGPSA